MPPRPPRLIDLHCDWPLQYVSDSTTFDPRHYPEIAAALPQDRNAYLAQTVGYLSETMASVIACYRSTSDWASQAEPWPALSALITRIEAEFPGRLLIDPRDWERWTSEPQDETLCWAVIGIEGFDALIRTPADLDRVPPLFQRGVRLFQMAYSTASLLAGSSEPSDDRGLSNLGQDFLQILADQGPAHAENGPRAILDLAHLNPRAMSEVLDWFERDASRCHRLGLVYSHGAVAESGSAPPRHLSIDNLRRLRALGGIVGLTPAPPFYPTIEAFRAGIEATAAIPFLGTPGHAGIGIGSDVLGVAQLVPGFANVSDLVQWTSATYDAATAHGLLHGNARGLLEGAVGVGIRPTTPS